jgi:dihydrofolate reductase
MRKLVLFMHVSLDGYVAGLKGEMNWIIVNEDMFKYSGRQTERSDLGLYGRVTYELMQAYWPTAGDEADASEHDKQHSDWYNKVEKVIISRTMKGTHLANTTILSDNIAEEIKKLKAKPGKDIVIFGSPSVGHFLITENLIDEYWIFVNPVILGKGIPLFKGSKDMIKLKLVSSEIFASGVVCLHYQRELKK